MKKDLRIKTDLELLQHRKYFSFKSILFPFKLIIISLVNIILFFINILSLLRYLLVPLKLLINIFIHKKLKN